MNRRQRKAKHARAVAHQRASKAKRRERGGTTPSAAALPKARRKRALPKRLVRKMGRKVRPE